MNRRDFLKFSALALSSASLRCAASERNKTGVANAAENRKPSEIVRYLDPLPLPKRAKPSRTSPQATEYIMRMTEFQQKLHSQLPPTTVWGFEGSYPGPVIEAEQGQMVVVRWENHLPLRHLFAIDPTIHGAMPPAPAVRTVTHLHGAHTASEDDGLPEKWLVPGESASYRYPNQQRATMLWYHDHAMGITRLNNYAGLAGIYFLRDQEERSLNLPAGDYEIPLVLQDRNLTDDAQLLYTPTDMRGQIVSGGRWGPEFFGRLPLVNGALYPLLEVEPRLYRFRVLNAANSRFFKLFFYEPTNPLTNLSWKIRQIGTDGGLLPAPLPNPPLLLAPAERLDLLVDFSGLEGREFLLTNLAPAPFPPAVAGDDEGPPFSVPLSELMKVRISRPLSKATSSATSSAKSAWSLTIEKLDRAAATVTRDFVLSEDLDANANSMGVKINGQNYDDPVTEKPKLNSTEIWRFINTTDDTHPMHIHLIQFQVLERTSFDLAEYLKTQKLKPMPFSQPPYWDERGWKDTVRANPGEILSVLVRFTGYTGRYVFHCHMLEHEDNETMRPFEVTT